MNKTTVVVLMILLSGLVSCDETSGTTGADVSNGSAGDEGCEKDTDCKGDRICENDKCVSPVLDAEIGDDQPSGTDAGSRDSSGADEERDSGESEDVQQFDIGSSDVVTADVGMEDVFRDGGTGDGGLESDVNGPDDGSSDSGSISDAGDAGDSGETSPIETVWRIDIGCSPRRIVRDGADNIYFYCYDGRSTIGINMIQVFDKNGQLLWLTTGPNESTDYSWNYFPLVLPNGRVAFSYDNKVTASDSNGFLWEYEASQEVGSRLREDGVGGIGFLEWDDYAFRANYEAVNQLGQRLTLVALKDDDLFNVSHDFFVVAGKLYFSGGDILFSFSTDGAFGWKTWLKGSATAPVMNNNGELVMLTIGASAWLAVIKNDGRLLWDLELKDYLNGQFVNNPVVGPDNTMYIASSFYMPEPAKHNVIAVGYDKAVKWVKHIDGNFEVKARPFLCADGTVLLASGDGVLYGIDQTGKELWKFKTGGAFEESPIQLSDGTIVFGTREKALYAIRVK